MKSFKTFKIIAPKISLAVLGSGSWATALVKILTDSGVHVHWYVRNPQQAQIIKTTFKNPNYLTSVKFRPRKITISTDINEVVSCCDWIILAIPSVFLLNELKLLNKPIDKKIIVSGVKGILPESKLIVGDHLNQYFKLPWEQFIVISGPSHAEEVALERLSYITLSSENRVNAEVLQKMMNTSYLKIKISKDVIGSEYAATLKNIYAVASGIAHGLNYGDNFQSVLISNSIREMKRFIKKVSPVKRNINETSYLGDLLVTSYSVFSRNRRFGNMIGRGYSVKSTQLEMNMIAEGYYATESIYNLSKSLGVRTPIIDAVYEILYKQKNSKKSFNRLTEKLD